MRGGILVQFEFYLFLLMFSPPQVSPVINSDLTSHGEQMITGDTGTGAGAGSSKPRWHNSCRSWTSRHGIAAQPRPRAARLHIPRGLEDTESQITCLLLFAVPTNTLPPFRDSARPRGGQPDLRLPRLHLQHRPRPGRDCGPQPRSVRRPPPVSPTTAAWWFAAT